MTLLTYHPGTADEAAASRLCSRCHGVIGVTCTCAPHERRLASRRRSYPTTAELQRRIAHKVAAEFGGN